MIIAEGLLTALATSSRIRGASYFQLKGKIHGLVIAVLRIYLRGLRFAG
jgi:hypothetical protein